MPRDEMRRRGIWERQAKAKVVPVGLNPNDGDPDAAALAAAEDAANKEPEEMGEFEEQGGAELEGFAAPMCPKCGSVDVVLAGVGICPGEIFFREVRFFAFGGGKGCV